MPCPTTLDHDEDARTRTPLAEWRCPVMDPRDSHLPVVSVAHQPCRCCLTGTSTVEHRCGDTVAFVDFADLEQQRLAAIVAGDGPELERPHTDDFLLCDPSGQTG